MTRGAAASRESETWELREASFSILRRLLSDYGIVSAHRDININSALHHRLISPTIGKTGFNAFCAKLV
jgi:hypothetical protein